MGGIRSETSSEFLGTSKKRSPGPVYWYMREPQRGTVSSNSSFQTVIATYVLYIYIYIYICYNVIYTHIYLIYNVIYIYIYICYNVTMPAHRYSADLLLQGLVDAFMRAKN